MPNEGGPQQKQSFILVDQENSFILVDQENPWKTCLLTFSEEEKSPAERWRTSLLSGLVIDKVTFSDLSALPVQVMSIRAGW